MGNRTPARQRRLEIWVVSTAAVLVVIAVVAALFAPRDRPGVVPGTVVSSGAIPMTAWAGGSRFVITVALADGRVVSASAPPDFHPHEGDRVSVRIDPMGYYLVLRSDGG